MTLQYLDFDNFKKVLQGNLKHEELRFADAVKKRSSILNRTDQEDSEDEDHFLESLRIFNIKR
ncbi:Protein CBG13907 [Caenorhabditis briggsae]|uniref:Protein CBG13907 n=1 Tax=Caenorhabditis briggsae TaxID=6238 RepID=A8XJ25_CAEBR|nr:Protein CBG13907 [Caenorhabditis briggsae]CAP32652.1 Protein CBG13907 [Caenorhabditis briggsae]